MGLRDFFERKPKRERELLYEVTCLQINPEIKPDDLAALIKRELEHFDYKCGMIESIDMQAFTIGNRDMISLVCRYTDE